MVGGDEQPAGSGGIGRLEPDEADHHARFRIQPIDRGIQCGRGDMGHVGVAVRIDRDVVDQCVDVDGAGGGSFHEPARLGVVSQSCAQHVVPVDHRGQGRDETGPVDPRRKFQGQ
ncbi:hypothetical protein NRB56_76580 [Nocardia sp. RB56]|uniref:Uncharacterized protein n=1 Tax=Nocardia aurantia TaxID=2585199 RepID=A0A7K0E2C5_9NOCA|nr:hypothetical protein [Nocardia aurantia]